MVLYVEECSLGRDLLGRGVRLRVGGVHDISAFQSPWIPRPRSFKPITSNVESPRDWKVSDFIPDRQWDVWLLSSVFWPMDIEVILSIPFSRREVADRLIWHYDPKGRNTVKSGLLVSSGVGLRLEFDRFGY